MSNGWIKLYRSTLKNPFMFEADVLGTWIYILLNVSYQQEDAVFEGKRITLQPGQGIFRFTEMAHVLGVTRSRMYRIIGLLESEKQIEKQSSPRNSIVTVINWSKYQSAEKQNETQVENKRETNEKQVGNLPIKERIEEVKKERNINNTNVLFVIPEDDEPQKTSEYQPVIDAWNSLPLKNITAIKGKRLDGVRARIKEYSLDDVLRAIEMIRNSPFLLGQNKQGWQITFDWFIRPNNFPKVLEGNYEKQQTTPTGKNDVQAGYQRMMEILGSKNGETD